MAFRIYLDGQLIRQTDHSSLADAELRYDFGEGTLAGIKNSLATNVTLYGAAYKIIQDRLINSPTALQNRVEVRVFDDRCRREVFIGKITSADIEFCQIGDQSGCEVDVTFQSDAQDDRFYECVINKLVATNAPTDPNDRKTGFHYQRHPYMRYCYKVRPDFLQAILIILCTAIYITTITLYPLVVIISVIVSIINLLPGVDVDFSEEQPGNQSLISWFTRFRQDIAEFATGCEEGAISPYVRSYIGNVCRQCGLTFSSSILNNPASDYFNVTYFTLPARGGDDTYTDNAGNLIEKTVDNYFCLNAPNENGYSFLNKMAGVFNAVWYIKGGVLIFEQQPLTLNQWLDLKDVTEREYVTSLCYQQAQEKPAAYGKFAYSQDGIDSVSNEELGNYNDIVDYATNPYNANFSGKKLVSLPFGPTAFRKTGLSSDMVDVFDDFLAIIGAYDTRYDYTICLERGTTIYPKLIIHDTASDPDYSTAVRYQRPNGNYYYNWAMWFAEGSDSEAIVKPAGGRLDTPSGFQWNLYRFWDREDPRKSDRKPLEFTVEMGYNCDLLLSFLDFSMPCTVRLPMGNGANETAVIGYVKTVSIRENKLTISGTL